MAYEITLATNKAKKDFEGAVASQNMLFVGRYYEAYTTLIRLSWNTDIITKEEYNRLYDDALQAYCVVR